jgi:preprotein translocase subunit YajC
VATQAAAPAAEPGAAAPPEQGLFGGPMMMVLMFVPLILLLFWQSRSQAKKQETLVSSLKKGDRVLTTSGLVGRLLEVDKRYAKLELAPQVRVQVLRSSLAGRDQDDTPSDSSKDNAKDSKDTSGKDDK